jgi:predicted MFS family arabinose efflux permease
MPPPTAPHQPPRGGRALLLAAVVIAVGVLSTTLGQTHVLARIPLQNLLKNTLHVDRSGNAAFFFWLIFPWYFKPLIGVLVDAYPLFGSRRRSYLMLGCASASLAWLALILTPQRYGALLGVGLVINTAMVVGSTVVGGYMVEAARASSGAGRLTSVRNFVEQVSILIAGAAGGLLASIPFGWTALTCGSIVFLIVPVAWWLLREAPAPRAAPRLLRDAGAQCRAIARARYLWAEAGLAGLFYFAPGTQTAIFYLQQNELHMSTGTQGYLTFLQGLFGVVGAILYGTWACRRLSLRTLLVLCLALGAAGNLAYLFYSSFLRAQFIDSFYGITFVLAEVALMHLAVQATPAGSEAFGFALMMSVRNLGLFGADWFGAWLLDRYHVSFHALVIANGATSLLAVPLVLLLPAALVQVRDRRERGPMPEPAA